MKTLIAALTISSALISSLAQAKDCLVVELDAKTGLFMSTWPKGLVYNPINQENGGDTFFMSAKITPDLTVQRESYLEDGFPLISIVEDATGKLLATSAPQASVTPGTRVEATARYKDKIYQVRCD